METVDEAIKDRPRLCMVWNNYTDHKEMKVVVSRQTVASWSKYVAGDGSWWDNAALVKRSEIEPFLGAE